MDYVLLAIVIGFVVATLALFYVALTLSARLSELPPPYQAPAKAPGAEASIAQWGGVFAYSLKFNTLLTSKLNQKNVKATAGGNVIGTCNTSTNDTTFSPQLVNVTWNGQWLLLDSTPDAARLVNDVTNALVTRIIVSSVTYKIGLPDAESLQKAVSELDLDNMPIMLVVTASDTTVATSPANCTPSTIHLPFTIATSSDSNPLSTMANNYMSKPTALLQTWGY